MTLFMFYPENSDNRTCFPILNDLCIFIISAINALDSKCVHYLEGLVDLCNVNQLSCKVNGFSGGGSENPQASHWLLL